MTRSNSGYLIQTCMSEKSWIRPDSESIDASLHSKNTQINKHTSVHHTTSKIVGLPDEDECQAGVTEPHPYNSID